VLFPILEKISDIYNLNIIIRLHPNENFKDYEKYFDRFKFLRYTNDILSLEECLAISDIVLVECSTVGLEAIACNKKVFTYKQDNEVYHATPAYKNLPFIFSNNLKELEVNLFGFLNDNDNDNFCTSTKFMPSNSVKNIIKLIKKV
jgi:CDP-glycerol glycerophosphotransferase (TagB/SpsB family)